MAIVKMKLVDALNEIDITTLKSHSVAMFSPLAYSLAYQSFDMLKEGNAEKARELFQQALDEDEAETRFQLGLRCFGINNERASSNFKRAVELHPDNATLRIIVGRFYHSMNKLEEAIEQFQEVARQDNVTAYINLGKCYSELGRYVEAEAAFKRVIELEHNWGDGHHHLGDLYFELGRTDEGEAVYKKAIESDPDDADGRATLAGRFIKQGRFAEAGPLLREATKLKPNITRHTDYKEDDGFRQLMDYSVERHLREWRSMLIRCYSEQNNTGELESMCREAEELGLDESNLVTIHMHLGRCYALKEDRYEEAKPHLRKATELDPCRSTYFISGLCAYYHEKYRDAEDALKKTIELDPNHADAHFYLSNCYASMKCGAADEAVRDDYLTKELEHLGKAVDLGSEDAKKRMVDIKDAIMEAIRKHDREKAEGSIEDQ